MAAYTFRAAGSISAGGGVQLTPGAPAGVQVGDLILLAAVARADGTTLTESPANFTVLASTESETETGVWLWGRIADGTASDTPTLQFSTGNSVAQLAAFSGDVYTDLDTIVAHVAKSSASTNTADLPNPAITISTDDTLVIGVGKKRKTTVSNGATLTSPTGLDNRIGQRWENGGAIVGFVWDYTQQTTAANISASVWDQDVEESLAYSSLIVALKTEAASGGGAAILQRYYAQLRGE